MVGRQSHLGTGRQGRQAGQILPLFVLSMVAVLAIGALVLDGASVLVTRRHLQDAGDAAALAGANTLQATRSSHLCSSDSGNLSGGPRNDIVNAVRASLHDNWPNFPPGNVSVTCPSGWENQAVQVDLNITSNSYLGSAIGASAQNVATTSIAVNGQVSGSNYNVVLLDPSNATWPNSRRGCPSFLISGGPTIRFDGSVMIDSACTAADGGALAANGGAATVTLAPGRSLNMVGGYNLGALTITPVPNIGMTALLDPLKDIDPIDYASMPIRSAVRLILSNETQVLEPGRYIGGIQLRNSSVALLRPGIYVLDGGLLDVGAQAAVCSITATSTATDCSSWSADCPDTTCGVLLFNRGILSGLGAMGQISVGAGSTLKLRAYDERAMNNVGFEYRNLLIWQDATPAASLLFAQPVIQLSGGGNVDISGTVYAPQAKVQMGGSSGGTGGSTVNLALQFIAWDLEISGNSSFRFSYGNDYFARPKDYGLVR
jgi:hypothetical protein